MSTTASKEDVDEILDLIREFMGQVDQRFNDMEAKYDRLISTIDVFVSRIDKYETELAARDSQFEKLLVWAR